MNSMIPMLLATLCAASCTLLDRCKTTAGVICAVVMAFAMFDICYFHLTPVSVIVAMVIGSGIWTAVSKEHASALSLRAFRGASAVVMGALLFHHAEAMKFLEEVCTGNSAFLHSQLKPNVVTSASAAVLFAAGVLLSAVMFTQTKHAYGTCHRLAVLEPAFMGISLVLMLL